MSDPTWPTAVSTWFASQGWQPFAFQQTCWQAYLNGGSGLIHSPTGSGKTLAAWLGPLIDSLATDTGSEPPLRVLWITPLRALAADTEVQLREALEGLQLNWTLARRTGDTSASQRARQRKKLPSALITTPESLSLLLSYADTQRQMGKLHAVVVDEWHELMGSKRGVQLELCLARLRRLNPSLRVWGMSATLGNLPQAMQVLLAGQPGTLVQSDLSKTTRIEALIPAQFERFPWAGHLGTHLSNEVVQRIEQADSTLLFTNTRSQTEIWFETLLKARTDWIGRIGLHHGSLDRAVRDDVEQRLRNGQLKCVVCTSSLDLGVDFTPVDQVIQVGSPKGLARLLQRAGRSGHQPGRVSRVVCVPTHAFELVEIAAARQAQADGMMECRLPWVACLDVLAQHAVTLALGGGFTADALFDEVRETHAFAALTPEQWAWVLDFISRGGAALQHYPQFQRVEREGDLFTLPQRRLAQQHRMMIGTISSDSSMWVKWESGGSLGSIEEAFIARLQPGDGFLFNGRVLELRRVKDMTAYVRLARKRTRVVPRWQGGNLPLSTELSQQVRRLFDPHARHPDMPEMQALRQLLQVQARWSSLPAADAVLSETIHTREGYHWFCFPFAGRAVHEGLAALLAYRLSRLTPFTATLTVNDYGFEVLSAQPLPRWPDVLPELLSEENLLQDLLASINESEMAKRQFRDIARVAGLIFQGYPGRSKTTRQLQVSSGILYEVLKQYDAGNLLLAQALDEVLGQQMDYQGLKLTLARLREARWQHQQPPRLTPLAFPLWADRLRGQTLSSETWQHRVQRMVERLEKAAAKDESEAHAYSP